MGWGLVSILLLQFPLVWSASANQLSVVQFNLIARFKIVFLVWAQQTSAAAQPQQNPVTIVQQHDASAQTAQEQAAGSTTPQAPIVQLQLPQEQLNLAHLIQNVGHGALPLTFSTLTPQQIQLLASK